MDVEKAQRRKIGEAIERFRMIGQGGRIAVAVSGGRDSVILLEVFLLLRHRALIDFFVRALTMRPGKFILQDA